VSNTDFVNSGSYLRTVFVLISGITTLTGLEGRAGFLGSGLCGATVFWGLEILPTGAVVGTGFAAGTGGWGFTGATGGFETWFAGAWVVFAGVLAILGGMGAFFAATGAVFLAGTVWTTFLGTGLAILLAAGAFLTDLAEPDEWAGFEAVFLAGAIFLIFAVFLAGLAAFFLVAIQLGFFCNEHF
jgi:hypothetical protein